MKLLISILVNGLIIFFLSWLLSGVYVSNFITAVVVGLILGLVNYTIRPILTILTLPLTIMSLGIFYLILNGLMVLLVDWLVPGFHVDGLFKGIVFTIFLFIVNVFVHSRPGMI